MTTVVAATNVIHHHFAGAGGLVDSLRPYVGKVDVEATSEVLEAVRVIVERADEGAPIPASTLSGIFELTNTVRRWALDSDGMLVRNKLINGDDWRTLMDWVVRIESHFTQLLGTLEARERETGDQPR